MRTVRVLCAAGLTGSSAAAFLCTRARSQAQHTLTVEAVVPATRFGATDIPGKEHWRIIGTKDVDNKGTLHSIGALDPFIFLDESLNPAGVGGLGSGKHPHAGIAAFTYLSPELEGTADGLIHAWDSESGDSPPHHAGSIYIINAGRGAVHHEANMTPGGVMHQFQLWTRVAEPLPPASCQLHDRATIPVVKLPDEAGHCRVMVGSQFGETSPARPPSPVQYLHVCLKPGRGTVLTVPRHHRGFAYSMHGTGIFGGNVRVEARQLGLLSPSDAQQDAELAVANETDTVLHFLLVTGEPIGAGPMFKKLGHGGSFVAGTEDGARKMQMRFEATGESFGKVDV